MRSPLNGFAAAITAAACALLTAGAAHADTFASSAIFNSFSTSVGSISTSFNASSDASSPGRPLRVGEYRVLEIVAAPGREGYARLTLRPQAEPEQHAAGAQPDNYLYLPLETVARAALAEGQRVSARARPYGLELSKLTPAAEAGAPAVREAFFLVVSDEHYRELQTRPVTL